ncbi:hypothetical protein [Ovoidimarina sediminis]|uniref:hypothetical protein n=1 Tax=Ovoidimarina sediminis TaxID=3079856 RepID=UPI0029112205|nr:hypothetical protein [Rhodophyticola sp. MJ-SS7]MDU8942807.1 hypothetical protein [Rhodophyticola sp. MJ-SS7]
MAFIPLHSWRRDAVTALLMSYPRSGSHMVRAVLEAASGRPTLGCPGNPADTPIRDRFPPSAETPFAREAEAPIAQKIHWVSEELALRRGGVEVERICLVIRDPAKCVVSQMVRSLDEARGVSRLRQRRRMARPGRLESMLFGELAHWMALVDRCAASDLPKLVLGFEDLVSPDGLAMVNEDLLPFFGLEHRFSDRAALDAVLAFGRESQVARKKTLPPDVYARNARASEIVREAVDYAEVRSRLGLPPLVSD